MWSRTFGGTGSEFCKEVQQTSDGGYILGGYNDGLTGYDMSLVKADANGDGQWSRTFNCTNDDKCNSVQQTSDGGYVLGGSTLWWESGEPQGFNMYLVKTDASGNRLWDRMFGGSGNDQCQSVQQTSDGGYILGGYTESFGAGNADMWLLKTGPDPTIPRPAPQALVFAIMDDEAVLNWQPSAGATLYHVYGSHTPGNSGDLIATVTSTTWTDPDFSARPTPYFYSVTAE